MISLRFAPSQSTSRFIVGWVVIAALAFHGLIPLGYMPDFSRHAGHPFAMTICSGMGPMAGMGHDRPGDAQNKKSGADQKKQGNAPCPFSVNAVFAFGGIDPGIVSTVYIFIATLVFAAFALAQSRRFGNASPRAPPLFS